MRASDQTAGQHPLRNIVTLKIACAKFRKVEHRIRVRYCPGKLLATSHPFLRSLRPRATSTRNYRKIIAHKFQTLAVMKWRSRRSTRSSEVRVSQIA